MSDEGDGRRAGVGGRFVFDLDVCYHSTKPKGASHEVEPGRWATLQDDVAEVYRWAGSGESCSPDVRSSFDFADRSIQ
jgi:hypothetical protein